MPEYYEHAQVAVKDRLGLMGESITNLPQVVEYLTKVHRFLVVFHYPRRGPSLGVVGDKWGFSKEIDLM